MNTPFHIQSPVNCGKVYRDSAGGQKLEAQIVGVPTYHSADSGFHPFLACILKSPSFLLCISSCISVQNHFSSIYFAHIEKKGTRPFLSLLIAFPYCCVDKRHSQFLCSFQNHTQKRRVKQYPEMFRPLTESEPGSFQRSLVGPQNFSIQFRTRHTTPHPYVVQHRESEDH